ncbi:unknown protein [Desulfotalea psychrophila LSv54]|uniref:Uncharacterized protein n=1 Tax=Desulfotalea psychrophila (strain LSv54 / DSM 12343) TaxID=177439 RepID=Q6AN04_DESPS|nr:unknown protein [Desulfotalea psychrophila LSv54]
MLGKPPTPLLSHCNYLNFPQETLGHLLTKFCQLREMKRKTNILPSRFYIAF